MKLTDSLKKVNSWTEHKSQETPIKSIQTLGKTSKKDTPRAMCMGTSCMDNQCGWNCGTVENRFMRFKKRAAKINKSSCKQRAA